MSEPLLAIRNHHAPASGDPPKIDGDEGNNYIGYFENPHGDQWIFTFDRDSQVATLRGGDIGWNEPVEIQDGAGDLVLGQEERLWLQAGMSACVQQHRW